MIEDRILEEINKMKMRNECEHGNTNPCPWCRVAELEAKLERVTTAKSALAVMFGNTRDENRKLEAENAKLLEWYREAIIDVGELVVEAKVFKDLEGRYVAAQYRQTNEIAELKAANKQLLGDLEIANLRLVAAWKENSV